MAWCQAIIWTNGGLVTDAYMQLDMRLGSFRVGFEILYITNG